VALQALLIAATLVLWTWRRWRPGVFLALSCAATLTAYGVIAASAYQHTRHLQEQFPYVSLEDRLPPARAARPAPPLPPPTAERLAFLEDRIEKSDHTWPDRSRSRSLRQFHEDTVQVFVNQSGFGVARMSGLSEYLLRSGKRDEPPVPQPGTPSASPWLPEELQKDPDLQGPLDDMLTRHQASVLDFVNPLGFGYVKDRRHVAGFQEHQLGRAPDLSKRWELQTLDLVGLVRHAEPTAYVSAHLPRMDELRGAPTRPPDEFEAAGLAALRSGDDLFVRDRGEERRMLGAIRATRQCLTCHEGGRGDLLGAFSYTLTRARK
jgi:hypothetical protein